METKIITRAYPWHLPFSKEWNLIENPKVDLIACCSHFTEEPEKLLTHLRCMLHGTHSDYYVEREDHTRSRECYERLLKFIEVIRDFNFAHSYFRTVFKQPILIKKVEDMGLLEDPEVRDNFYSALLLT